MKNRKKKKQKRYYRLKGNRTEQKYKNQVADKTQQQKYKN